MGLDAPTFASLDLLLQQLHFPLRDGGALLCHLDASRDTRQLLACRPKRRHAGCVEHLESLRDSGLRQGDGTRGLRGTHRRA